MVENTFFDKISNSYGQKGCYSVINFVKSTMVKSDRYFDNLREPKLTDFEWIKKLDQ